MERYIPTEYERTIEEAFARAPFRMEYRPYLQPASKLGIWQIMHPSNGAIIATGDTPAEAVARLVTMAERMDDVRRGLPSQGRKAQG